MYAKKEKVYPANVSKYNSNPGKQVLLLKIQSGEGWYYLAITKLSILLRGITSKYHGDFYCPNCLHSFATENKREFHKKVCENKDVRNIMPSEDTKILEFNQYRGAAHCICKNMYLKKFHNGSNYHYHFVIKELAEEFEKQFTCLGENTEKYIHPDLIDFFWQ